jgi:hypothetical protein
MLTALCSQFDKNAIETAKASYFEKNAHCGKFSTSVLPVDMRHGRTDGIDANQ